MQRGGWPQPRAGNTVQTRTQFEKRERSEGTNWGGRSKTVERRKGKDLHTGETTATMGFPKSKTEGRAHAGKKKRGGGGGEKGAEQVKTFLSLKSAGERNGLSVERDPVTQQQKKSFFKKALTNAMGGRGRREYGEDKWTSTGV